MKKERKEPVFLLEMPHSLRHMIMRRGLMLRSSRARTLCCMNKSGPKAWLEAKLIPSAGDSAEENWDKAHELAGRFKRELHADVYVEPASRDGRYLQICSGERVTQPPPPPIPVEASRRARSFSGAGSFGLTKSEPPSFDGLRLPGHSPFPAIDGTSYLPHIPDPVKEISELIAGFSVQSKQQDLVSCRDLHQLPGWDELSSNCQQMFETEASQLIKRGLTLDGNATKSDCSILAMLSLQPGISKNLQRFLENAFSALSEI